jgi:hypothetical protein
MERVNDSDRDSRIDALTNERLTARRIRVDRMFAVLLVVQWLAAIATAVFFSPYAWAGRERVIHVHVWIALLGGGGLILLPVLLAWFKPGAPITRHVIAAAQMLSSALLIHLSGGRIETHFHVFGSLAFLAFYLDWPVLITATIIVATDHFLRGVFWPESVYGTVNAEWWRFLEHAFWVAFEDVFLIWSCILATREMRENATRQIEVEDLSEQEQLKSAALEMALAEMSATA